MLLGHAAGWLRSSLTCMIADGMSNELTPVSQAAAMIRRVSPEGRAAARRERERRRRASRRVMGRIALAAVFILLASLAFGWGIEPLGTAGVLVAAVAFAVACSVILLSGRNRAVPASALTQASVARLPAQTQLWLEEQRATLPLAAAALLDDLSLKLDELAPQVTAVDANEPGAEAVRRLLARDLPALVRGYQAVPASLRARPGSEGRTPDAQLLDGLAVIDGEMRRMSEQLARGAFDELATQGRFLETRYEGPSQLG